jgi:hypothetical protein
MPGHGAHVGVSPPRHLDEDDQLFGSEPQSARIGTEDLDGATQVRPTILDWSV